MRKFVSKVWGFEDWLANSSLYCGKLLFLKKNKRLSLHYHKLKDETFYIQSGEVEVAYYDEPELDTKMDHWTTVMHNEYIQLSRLTAGDTFHVPIGRRHTLFGVM